jgi:hypothetical protein
MCVLVCVCVQRKNLVNMNFPCFFFLSSLPGLGSSQCVHTVSWRSLQRILRAIFYEYSTRGLIGLQKGRKSSSMLYRSQIALLVCRTHTSTDHASTCIHRNGSTMHPHDKDHCLCQGASMCVRIVSHTCNCCGLEV